MKVCVQGLWHLGLVMAVGLAKVGHTVKALDYDTQTIDGLVLGVLPVEEPGVRDLLSECQKANNLTFIKEAKSIGDCEIFWLAYDTPVDENDVADVDFVLQQFQRTMPYLNSEALVIVSSQLPVGTTRKLKKILNESIPGNRVRFASQPENLRLGRALDSFLQAERFIIGTESSALEPLLEELFLPFNTPLVWMSIESAEMTKHAINAFLAASITFMNEISNICESVGADAKAVESGLRTDSRIGMKAYVSPGLGFSGGTLARDVKFLESLEDRARQGKTLLSSLIPSNQFHNGWVKRKIDEIFVGRTKLNIVFWGLTYTTDTSTLRRSAMLELAIALSNTGHDVSFFEDPIVDLPIELTTVLKRVNSPIQSISEVDAVIVSKGMAEFADSRTISALAAQENVVVLDPSRHLMRFLNVLDMGKRYLAVGSVNEH
jgi:UDPglucose 6-dehydrogenase